MKKGLSLVLLTLLSTILLTACGSKKLSGKYSTTVDIFVAKQTDTLEFDGDKVTESQDGKVNSTGTYKIDDDKIEITLDDYHMEGELSKDRNSFKLTSSDVLFGIGKGMVFKKEDSK